MYARISIIRASSELVIQNFTEKDYSNIPLSFAILQAIPVCPTLWCFRALIRTVQLGSPLLITWSSLRSHAVITSSRKVSESFLAFTLCWLSPRTSPRWYTSVFSIFIRYPVISKKSSSPECTGKRCGQEETTVEPPYNYIYTMTVHMWFVFNTY